MNISHSIVSETTIKQCVKEHYEVNTELSCKFLYQGLNDTYLIKDNNKHYVFRLYRYNWRTLGDIGFEINTIKALTNQSAPIAQLIKCKSGDTYIRLDCPEGERYGILMDFVGDTEQEQHCFLTNQEYQYGRSVAQLHQAARNVSSTSASKTIDLQTLIWKPLSQIRQYFPDKKGEYNFLHELAHSIATKVENLEKQGLAKHILHGDLTGGNAKFNKNGDFIFFDFDCCGYGCQAYDLAVFLWSATLCRKEQTTWNSFVQGYKEIIDIRQNDLLAIPLFVAARGFWIIGYSIDQIPIKGSLSYNSRHLEEDINFLKQWKCELPGEVR